MATEKTMRDWPVHHAEFTLPIRYHLQKSQGSGTVILLHGYQDHALSMFRRIGWFEKDLPFNVLAVNAPFPVPIWKSDGFVEAYSWYFRDTRREIMLVDPRVTAERVGTLINKILSPSEPLAILGFSQGGFLAPFLAKHLPSLRAILGVGSGYPFDPYSHIGRTDIRVHAFHDETDDRWPIKESQASHKKILELGFTGDFHIVPGLGHKVDPMLDPLIRPILLAEFGARP